MIRNKNTDFKRAGKDFLNLIVASYVAAVIVLYVEHAIQAPSDKDFLMLLFQLILSFGMFISLNFFKYRKPQRKIGKQHQKQKAGSETKARKPKGKREAK